MFWFLETTEFPNYINCRYAHMHILVCVCVCANFLYPNGNQTCKSDVVQVTHVIP